MIDYNKYVHHQIKNTSSLQATNQKGTRSKKKTVVKLNKNNKAFLKAIGLLK